MVCAERVLSCDSVQEEEEAEVEKGFLLVLVVMVFKDMFFSYVSVILNNTDGKDHTKRKKGR